MRSRRKPPGGPASDGSAAAPQAPRAPKTPAEQRDDLLAYAFRALGQRALSAAELRTKLERRSDDAELIAEVLARVQELGYQQDEQVARIETSRRGVGQFRVRQTLKRRGLEAELIQQTLADMDPDEERQAAHDLLTRRWPSIRRKRDPRATAYSLLARRGFPGSIIWDVIREVAEAAGEDAGADDLPETFDGDLDPALDD